MSEIQTWPKASGVREWRTPEREQAPAEKAADMLRQHHGFHAAAQRSYGVYLAISILLFGVIAVYALATLFGSLGGVTSALGH